MALFPLEKDFDGKDKATFYRVKINPQTTDPTTPVENVPWFNTTEKKYKFYDGTAVQTIATRADIDKNIFYRGLWDATAGVPTSAGSAILTNEPIKIGDFWRVSVAGTISGLLGEEELEIGDYIYAEAENASTAGQFFGANTSVTILETADQKAESIAGVDLVASTPLVVNSTELATVNTYTILNGTKDLSASFEVDINTATPGITIASHSAYTGLQVILIGTPS